MVRFPAGFLSFLLQAAIRLFGPPLIPIPPPFSSARRISRGYISPPPPHQSSLFLRHGLSSHIFFPLLTPLSHPLLFPRGKVLFAHRFASPLAPTPFEAPFLFFSGWGFPRHGPFHPSAPPRNRRFSPPVTRSLSAFQDYRKVSSCVTLLTAPYLRTFLLLFPFFCPSLDIFALDGGF